MKMLEALTLIPFSFATSLDPRWMAQHQQRSYISLTVHFVDIDFELKSKCLQTLEVPQDHNASSLMEVLDSMLKDWNISEKVCGGITDNGSNIVNAIGLMEIEHFPCFADTLQLSIKNGLNVPRVQQVLGRCKKLVEHFKKSTKETYKLREKQEMLKLPQHKLIQDCVTRWGSTLGMLTRLQPWNCRQPLQVAIAGSHCSRLDGREE